MTTIIIASCMPTLQRLDEVLDHVRGPATGRILIEYGDYECPYSRQAYRSIQRVEATPGVAVRFCFRHFPLTEIHPHALAAAGAAEAAALQGRFWEMHDMLFGRQKALTDSDLHRYALEIGLDVEAFESARIGSAVLSRIDRDRESGRAGEVLGTPTLFIDGVVYRGSYDTTALVDALAG
ncbi:MAG: DsbA family protein [Candidatus Dormiibacterota bacterium]